MKTLKYTTALCALKMVGCLSLDAIATRDASPPANLDAGADTVVDAGPGDDAMVDAGRPACVDRGRYTLDGIRVQGRSDGCDGDRVCIDGRCVEEPTCKPGLTDACAYDPSAGRVRSNLVAVGDAFYWLEAGAVGPDGAYFSGALMRIRGREFRVEVVVPGLDFHSEVTQEIPSHLELFESGGWFISSTGPLEVGQHLIRVDASEVRIRPSYFIGETVECMTNAGEVIVQRPVADRPGVTQWIVNPEYANNRPLLYGSTKDEPRCVVRDDLVALQLDYDAPIVVFDLQNESISEYAPAERLVGFADGIVRVGRDGALSVADASAPPISWFPLRNLTEVGKSLVRLRDDTVIWSRVGERNDDSVVLRASLTDKDPPHVLAERAAITGAEFSDPADAQTFAITDAWVAYWGDGQLVHFVPYVRQI